MASATNNPVVGACSDRRSRVVTDSRQGQISRFELLLLAALGDRFIRARGGIYLDSYYESALRKLQAAGITPTNTSPPDGARPAAIPDNAKPRHAPESAVGPMTNGESPPTAG